MNIGILGAKGFIASHLIEFFKEKHIGVHSYARNENVKVHDLIVHLAQPNRLTHVLSDLEAEHLSLLKVLKSKCAHIIYVSSAAVYGYANKAAVTEKTTPTPSDDYGKFKYYCEQQVQCLFSSFAIVRPSNVYGGGMSPQSIIGEYLDQKEKGRPVIQFKKAYPTRDFIFIDDLVSGIYQITKNQCQGIYNVSSGQGTSIQRLVSVMDQYFSRHSTFDVTTSDQIDYLVLDPSKLISDTSWVKPREFIDTFSRFLESYATKT
jgi:nucleoside-diphosphate-sugar epimerase